MKSTSSHLINFTQFRFARARINDGTIDKIAAKKAIARWRWAVETGHASDACPVFRLAQLLNSAKL